MIGWVRAERLGPSADAQEPQGCALRQPRIARHGEMIALGCCPMDLMEEFKNIGDFLIPGRKRDPFERSLSYRLLRHSPVMGKEASVFGVATFAESTAVLESTVRERIRKLEKKGCM